MMVNIYSITVSTFFLVILFVASFGPTIIGYSGPVTLAAFATSCYFLVGSLVFVQSAYTFRLHKIMIVYLLFLTYGCLSFVWGGVNGYGIQNLMVFTLFFLTFSQRRMFAGQYDRIDKFIKRCAAIFATGYLLTVLRFGLGNEVLYGARPSALFMLILLAWVASGIVYETDKRKRIKNFWLSIYIFMTIAATLGRTATGVGFLVIAFSILLDFKSKKKLFLLIIVLVLAVLLGVYLIKHSEIVAERFSGNDVVNIGGIDVNFAGRTKLWLIALKSWSESTNSMFFGKGAGTVGAVLQKTMPEPHPHNEYVRLLHDYGVVGLLLWLSAMVLIVKNAIRRFKEFVAAKDRLMARANYAGINACVVIFCASMFVNALVFVFTALTFSLIVSFGYSQDVNAGTVEE